MRGYENNQVFLSWRLFAEEDGPSTTQFNVYRALATDAEYPSTPMVVVSSGSTTYFDQDPQLQANTKYKYKVKAVINGIEMQEGRFDNEAFVTTQATRQEYIVLDLVDDYIEAGLTVGDLDDDGLLELVVSYKSKITKIPPSYEYRMQAFKLDFDGELNFDGELKGRSMWRVRTPEGQFVPYIRLGRAPCLEEDAPDPCSQNLPRTQGVTMHNPVTVWDINNDRRAEVIYREGDYDDRRGRLKVIDGQTPSRAIFDIEFPTPPEPLLVDFDTSANRIFIAYLDQVEPAAEAKPYIVVGRGLHNITHLWVLDPSQARGPILDPSQQLSLPIIAYKDFDPLPGTAHGVQVVDVNGDRKDEMIWREGCWRLDTSMPLPERRIMPAWPESECSQALSGYSQALQEAGQYKLHTHGVIVAKIKPDRQGLEVVFARHRKIESDADEPTRAQAALLVAQAEDGRTIWSVGSSDYPGGIQDGAWQSGLDIWVAKVYPDLGMQVYGIEVYGDAPGMFLWNRDGKHPAIYSGPRAIFGPPLDWNVEGVKQLYADGDKSFPSGVWTYDQWIASDNTHRPILEIRDDQGPIRPIDKGVWAADIFGDAAEELVIMPGGSKIYIFTNVEARAGRRYTPLQDRKYRLDMSRFASGYRRDAHESGRVLSNRIEQSQP